MLEDKITQDYIQAMKSKETAKASALSFLRAQIKNVMIDKRVEKVADEDVIAVIKKQVKQRQDSIEQFKQGGRADLVAKETAELALLQSYLPAEMSNDQLTAIVQETIKSSQAASIKDMGKVMKDIMPKVAGKADNKRVSDMIKELLSKMNSLSS